MPFFAFLIIATAIAAGMFTCARVIRDRATAAIACVAGASAIVLIDGIFYVRFYADDAFITLRYSRNFAEGHGPVWNPGQHVEGYTSFSWMAILAGMHRIGFDLEDASLLLSYAAMVATLCAVTGIWWLWSRDGDVPHVSRHPAVLSAALILTGVSAPIVVWGFSGMETPFAAMLLTGGAWLLFREARDGGPPYSALAFAAGAMTRPEFLPVAAMTALSVAARDWRAAPAAALRRAMRPVSLPRSMCRTSPGVTPTTASCSRTPTT